MTAAPARRLGLVALGALVVLAIAAVASGELTDRWEEFKAPGFQAENTTSARIESVAGNGRYQYWEASLDAFASAPAGGIGPGTWEFWWAREGSFSAFVKDAHSLYFEVLAEAGIVGFVLLAALFALILGVTTTRLFSIDRARADIAAILAGLLAFSVAAAIDWSWELPVLPVTFMLLAAAALGTQRITGTRANASPSARGYGLAGLAAILAMLLWIPALATKSLAGSRDAAARGDLVEALDKARTAQDLQPYSATAKLQEALVLERGGVLREAAAAAREAAEKEPTNWRPWYVLGRIEEARGLDDESNSAYDEARALNPRSPLFAPANVTEG